MVGKFWCVYGHDASDARHEVVSDADLGVWLGNMVAKGFVVTSIIRYVPDTTQEVHKQQETKEGLMLSEIIGSLQSMLHKKGDYSVREVDVLRTNHMVSERTTIKPNRLLTHPTIRKGCLIFVEDLPVP